MSIALVLGALLAAACVVVVALPYLREPHAAMVGGLAVAPVLVGAQAAHSAPVHRAEIRFRRLRANHRHASHRATTRPATTT